MFDKVALNKDVLPGVPLQVNFDILQICAQHVN